MAHEVIVIGAGHNGLTTAALLARAGRRVLLLERGPAVGGIAVSDEFHPGYRGGGLLHSSAGVRDEVVRELRLDRHGLRRRRSEPDALVLGNSSALRLPGDPDRAHAAITDRSASDGSAYREYTAFSKRIRPVLRRFLDEPALDLVDLESMSTRELLSRALQVRRLGRRDMPELLRVAPLSLADRLDECFASDSLKLSLALPAMTGLFTGPRAPGTNLNRMLLEASAGPGIEGGGPALVAALESAARDADVEIRTEAPVARIRLDSGRTAGVVLENGEELTSDTVAASCDPRQLFLDLLPPGALTRRQDQRLRHFRARGTLAQLLLALDRPVTFGGGEAPAEIVHIGAGLDALERSYDALKYRRLPENPVLEIHVPTVTAPKLAPAGHAVLSVLIHGVPYDLHPEWNDAARTALVDRTLDILERHIPDLTDGLVARRLLAPPDLESRYALPSGNLHHGEPATDQLILRPAPDCNRYRTPVPGLFLCGSGAHPGGGLTCAPALQATKAILAP